MGRNVHRGLEIVDLSHGRLTPDVRSDSCFTGPNAPPSFYTTADVHSDPFFSRPNEICVRLTLFYRSERIPLFRAVGFDGIFGPLRRWINYR